jgi:hypothetical protein
MALSSLGSVVWVVPLVVTGAVAAHEQAVEVSP